MTDPQARDGMMQLTDEQIAFGAFLANYPAGQYPTREECYRSGIAFTQRWRSMDSAPTDGTRILISWGPRVVIGRWLDNSQTSVPWTGWVTEGMHPRAANERATRWLPLPPESQP